MEEGLLKELKEKLKIATVLHQDILDLIKEIGDLPEEEAEQISKELKDCQLDALVERAEKDSIEYKKHWDIYHGELFKFLAVLPKRRQKLFGTLLHRDSFLNAVDVTTNTHLINRVFAKLNLLVDDYEKGEN